MLLDLTCNIVVMYSIFKLIKVVLSMSQNEAAFYNNLKSHPFRVLKLHIYSVIGILEELQSASSPVFLWWLCILRRNWVAVFLYHCTVPVFLGEAAVLASCQMRQMFMEASPDVLNSSHSGWNVISGVAHCWLDLSEPDFTKSFLQEDIFFILAHEMPSLQTPKFLLICFSAHYLPAHNSACFWFARLPQSSTLSTGPENECSLFRFIRDT